VNKDYNPWKDHRATYKKYDDNLETLEWKEPGTNHFAIWYVRQHGTLMVFGDLGEAVYQWYPDVTLQGIANTNFDYFVGKCRASEFGTPPKVWSADQAETDAREYFAEFFGEKWQDTVERSDRASEDDKFRDADGLVALREDRLLWDVWLRENATDVFGPQFYEVGIQDWGMRYHQRIHLHHEGLNKAFQQLAEKGQLP
jgi:hypothetical protein